MTCGMIFINLLEVFFKYHNHVDLKYNFWRNLDKVRSINQCMYISLGLNYMHAYVRSTILHYVYCGVSM